MGPETTLFFPNKVAWRAFVTGVLFFFISATSANESLPERVLFVGDIWCPYNCAEDEEKKGALVDLLSAIVTNQNVQLGYQVVPWSRALKDVSEGRIDGIIGAGKADLKYAELTNKPWVYAELATLTHRDADFHWQGTDSLAGKSVLVIANYEYADPLPAWLAANPSSVRYLRGENAFKQAVQMILHKRHDIFFSSFPALRRYVQSAGLGENLIVTRTGFKTPIYMGVARGKPYSQSLLKLLNEGFERANKSGKLAEIVERYQL